MDWALDVRVVQDPGQIGIRATVFDPFESEALIRPTPHGVTLFNEGGNFIENTLAYDSGQYFTVAIVNGTVSNVTIDVDDPDTVIPAGIYRVPIDFDHPEMYGTLRMNVDVTVIQPPARFYRRNFDYSQERVIPNAEHTLSADARAIFVGVRRNLTIMHITPVGGDLLNTELQARQFDRIRRFCEAGAPGWRLPTFSEVAGILDDVDAAEGQFTRRDANILPGGGGGDPTENFALQYSYRVNPNDIYDRGSVIGTDLDNGGHIADFIVAVAGEPRFAVARNNRADPTDLTFGFDPDNLDIFCVREHNEDLYNPPTDPAGIQAKDIQAGETGTIQITIFARPDLVPGEFYETVTVEAWRYESDSRGSLRVSVAVDNVVNYDLGPATPLIAEQSRSPDGAGLILKLRPRQHGINTNAVMSAWPAVGRTVNISIAVLHPLFTFNDVPVYLLDQEIDSGRVVEGKQVLLKYHGKRRGLHVLYSSSGGDLNTGFLPLAASEPLQMLCDNSEGPLDQKFRPPRLGELGGLLSTLEGPIETEAQVLFAASALPAGFEEGLNVDLGSPEEPEDAPVLTDPLQFFSRNILGNHTVFDINNGMLRSRVPTDFPDGARAACVLSETDDNPPVLPVLRGVRLDGAARDAARAPVPVTVYQQTDDAANNRPNLALRATATLSREVEDGGAEVFSGLIQYWRHWDDPEQFPGVPEVEAASPDPDGFTSNIFDHPSGKRVVVNVAAQRPIHDDTGYLELLATNAYGADARVELLLITEPLPLTLAPIDAIVEGGLNQTIHAALGHTGLANEIRASRGYRLEPAGAPVPPTPEVVNFSERSAAGRTFYEVYFPYSSDFFGDSRVTVRDRFELIFGCDPGRCDGMITATVNLTYIPVAGARQAIEKHREGGLVSGAPLLAPSGFETGGTFAEDETAYAHGALFVVDSDTGAVSGAPGQTIPVGSYIVPITYTHPDVVGAIKLERGVEILPVDGVALFNDQSFAAVGEAQLQFFAAPFNQMLNVVYLGTRRDMEMTEIRAAGAADSFQSHLRAQSFAEIRALCEEAGPQWRMPTFLESLGAIYDEDANGVAGGTASGEFTKAEAARLPGYPEADRTYSADGIPAKLQTDTATVAVSAGFLADVIAVSGGTGDPVLLSWDGASPAPQANVAVAGRKILCVRPNSLNLAQTSGQNPAGVAIDGAIPSPTNGHLVRITRPADYTPGGFYGGFNLDSYRYDDNGNVEEQNFAQFTATSPDGTGFIHEQTRDDPVAKSYRFGPEAADQVAPVFSNIILTPQFGAEATLRIELIRALDLAADSVLPEVAPSVPVARGYTGRGFEILPNPYYNLFNFTPDPGVTFDEPSREIRLAIGDASDPVNPFYAGVNFMAECIDGLCSGAAPVGITVAFVPVSDPGQTRLRVDPENAVSISGEALVRPTGYDTGGSFEEDFLAYQNPQHSGYFDIDPQTGAVSTTENQNPPIGAYAVPVLFSHPGFLGRVSMTVEIEILPEGAVAPFGMTADPANPDDPNAMSIVFFNEDNPTLTISADDHELDLPYGSEIQAVYVSIRRGLEIARITTEANGGTLLASELALANGAGFAPIRQFCSSRGFGWRMPTFAEALGLVDDGGNPVQYQLAVGANVPGVVYPGSTPTADLAALETSPADAVTIHILADHVVMDSGAPALAAWNGNLVPISRRRTRRKPRPLLRPTNRRILRPRKPRRNTSQRPNNGRKPNHRHRNPHPPRLPRQRRRIRPPHRPKLAILRLRRPRPRLRRQTNRPSGRRQHNPRANKQPRRRKGLARHPHAGRPGHHRPNRRRNPHRISIRIRILRRPGNGKPTRNPATPRPPVGHRKHHRRRKLRRIPRNRQSGAAIPRGKPRRPRPARGSQHRLKLRIPPPPNRRRPSMERIPRRRKLHRPLRRQRMPRRRQCRVCRQCHPRRRPRPARTIRPIRLLNRIHLRSPNRPRRSHNRKPRLHPRPPNQPPLHHRPRQRTNPNSKPPPHRKLHRHHRHDRPTRHAGRTHHHRRN